MTIVVVYLHRGAWNDYVFYASNVTLFIAMTALARLIILQGKEMDQSHLFMKQVQLPIIALACLIVRFKPPWTREDE